MGTTPADSSNGPAILFDPSLPFRGVVICCTSIPPEQRSDIAAKTAELGGIHKYDLTPDVTHLLVGEYDTAKYRHVAKQRPDITPMAAGWVEAVRGLWVQDADIDFAALEETWRLRTLETSGGDSMDTGNDPQNRSRLLCCLTGFEDPEERQRIMDMVLSNGGEYTGDLTRKVTHLIVNEPKGRKYAAAKSWGVQTVSIEWLQDSVQRRMILDEKCYDPTLPAEERGKGAWIKREVTTVALGKRLREGAAAAQEEGKRKLRKTASMKLNSQRDNLWGDILGKPASADASARPADGPTQPSNNTQISGKSLDTEGTKLGSLGGTLDDDSVFASCGFYIHDFAPRKTEVLTNTVSYMGGLICNSLDDLSSSSGAQLAHRFLIVPQDSRPDTHPQLPVNVHIVTEFFIEKCLHKKRLFDPNDHVIGQPFPAFPIDGFDKLAICTAGFTGVDLNQVDKAIRQLGARYEERFTPQSSVLICAALQSVRKQKLELALEWKVPVVSADWLWSCISTGFKVPIQDFMFPELGQRLSPDNDEAKKEEGRGRWHQQKDVSKNHEPGNHFLEEPPARKPAGIRGIDLTAFTHEEAREDKKDAILDNDHKTVTARQKQRGEISNVKDKDKEEDSGTTASTEFETAPTHLSQVHAQEAQSDTHEHGSRNSAPLSEVSSNPRQGGSGRSQSSQKNHASPGPGPKPRSRAVSEIANSEATDDDDNFNGESADLNGPDADENRAPLPVGESGTEIGKGKDRRIAEDAATARIAAEERAALSARLATLLGPSVAAGTMITPTGTGAGDHASDLSLAHANGNPRSRNVEGVLPPGLSAAPLTAPAPAPRRRREIFGRAISNVSAASSCCSVESSVGGGGGPESEGPLASVGVGLASAPASASASAEPPPSTQLGYEDPDAERCKAQLVRKMRGESGGRWTPAATEAPGGVGGRQSLTLAEMGGYENAARVGLRTRRR